MEHRKWVAVGVIAAGLSGYATAGLAQAKAMAVPDAQVESNVLKALASNSKLADQTISSSTVYGTVTLSGSVRDEESRTLAETLVSQTSGVQKVIDELTLGAPADTGARSPDTSSSDSNSGSNPLLQSDGTLAPSPAAEQTSPDVQRQPDPRGSQDAQQTYGQQPPYAQQPPSSRPPYDDQRQGQNAPEQQSDQGDQTQPSATSPYGPHPRRPYGQPPSGPPSPYQQSGRTPYGAQEAGRPVTVAIGSMLRVRMNQGLDSKHTQPGTTFDAVVLTDVVADGSVAIPRGAMMRGAVVEAQQAGALKGRGELGLQLTQVTLSGITYPIASDIWSNHGSDKTARTVNSALGLGVVGAIIGGVTGGGAGAAIGAGVGGVAGVGASAASGGGQAFIPSEAILTFHLTQPAALATTSQAEMDRLRYGVPAVQQVRRRYVQPAPYPYPVYYPRYPYPYASYPYPYRYEH